MDPKLFIQQMPKIELHAHLSGSISKQTVRELINLHRQNYPNETIPSNVIQAFSVPDDDEEVHSNNISQPKKEQNDTAGDENQCMYLLGLYDSTTIFY